MRNWFLAIVAICGALRVWGTKDHYDGFGNQIRFLRKESLMSKIKHKPNLEDLNGAEHHFDLKNKPGEKADPHHAEPGVTPDPELTKAVEEAEGDTQIADELRKVSGASD